MEGLLIYDTSMPFLLKSSLCKKQKGVRQKLYLLKINTMPLRSLIIMLMIFNCIAVMAQTGATKRKPLRVAIVGLVHTHVHWILGYEKKDEIEIVGIAEADRQLAETYSKQHGYKMDMVYTTMEEMIQKTKPEAVLAFNTIYDHLKVVEYCAPRGIHVMVEKPLAVSNDHAMKMLALAKKHNIHLLTNYETTWYGSNAKAYQIIKQDKQIGDIRKIVFSYRSSRTCGNWMQS